MKALITTTLIAVSAFAGVAQAEVSTRYKFVAADQAAESSVCVVAAKDGYAAAKDEAAKVGLKARDVICNTKSLSRFARKYNSVNKVDVANVSL